MSTFNIWGGDYLNRLCKRLSEYTTSCSKSPYCSSSTFTTPLLVIAVSHGHWRDFNLSSEFTCARSWAFIRLARTLSILPNKNQVLKVLRHQNFRLFSNLIKRIFLYDISTTNRIRTGQFKQILGQFLALCAKFRSAHAMLCDVIS